MLNNITVKQTSQGGTLINYTKDDKPHAYVTRHPVTERVAEVILDQLPDWMHEENKIQEEIVYESGHIEGNGDEPDYRDN